MLGGIAQIDPIWVYGPYDPIAIIPGAQPDWYLGWVEGAMRLFPGVDLHFGHYVVPQIFFPGMLFPVLVFLCLYAYPFVDQMFSFDPTEHNVLALPQQRPFNTAFGCSVLMAMLVLLFTGGDDVIAVATDTSVITIRAILRVLFFVAPAFTAFIVYRLCRRKILRRDSETH